MTKQDQEKFLKDHGWTSKAHGKGKQLAWVPPDGDPKAYGYDLAQAVGIATKNARAEGVEISGGYEGGPLYVVDDHG